MKKYSKPILDIIEFDNMDVIVMSGEMTTSDEPDDGGADDRILVEQPINSDSTNVSEGHEESVEPTLEEGNPIEDSTSGSETPVEESVEESVPETEETSVPDESVS